MLIVKEKIIVTANLNSLERDTVFLNWEDRRKSRQKIKTEKGVEIAIALPTGTILNDGDILYRDDKCCIAVEAEKEDVISIQLDDITGSAMIAYELGNRHAPVSFSNRRLMTPYNHLIEGLLKRLGIRYECKKDIFEPFRTTTSHG
ncbi:MAG: urease accessory protein UreE [Nitrospirae bacterium]|nr:urease accessory protein UreE [Nitrospirota bacterium]